MSNIIRVRTAKAVARIAVVILWVAGNHGECHAQSLDSPVTRLQPIGAPSRVDQYRNDRNRIAETEYREIASPRREVIGASYQQYQTGDSNIRQTAMLQAGGFEAPPSGFAPPPSTFTQPGSGAAVTNPSTPPSLPRPPVVTAPPSAFVPAPRNSLPLGSPIASSSDFQSVQQPRLGNVYANVDNCACVTGPSGYSAASVGCGSPAVYAAPGYGNAPTYAPPASTLVPPTLMPGQIATPSANAAPLPSLLTFGQQYNPVQVGQGIIGQPVAYVPGQTIRNFIRYLSP